MKVALIPLPEYVAGPAIVNVAVGKFVVIEIVPDFGGRPPFTNAFDNVK